MFLEAGAKHTASTMHVLPLANGLGELAKGQQELNPHASLQQFREEERRIIAVRCRWQDWKLRRVIIREVAREAALRRLLERYRKASLRSPPPLAMKVAVVCELMRRGSSRVSQQSILWLGASYETRSVTPGRATCSTEASSRDIADLLEQVPY